MFSFRTPDILNFFVTGINYKKTDAALRGQFAVSPEKYGKLLNDAKHFGVQELFVLSTCNRTEIYGVAEDISRLTALLCSYTEGSPELFDSLSYKKSGINAVEHLFFVGAGLDSQILGDYEIVGQIKQSVKTAKEQGAIGAFLERLINSVLQSSKVIKNETALSGGTVSVSFAAIQYIKEKFLSPQNPKILLLGVGKIGRNTCKNLVDYLDTTNITLINRTPEKAAGLAGELGVNFAPLEHLEKEIRCADIILVATNSEDPTILKSYLEDAGEKLIIDLSVPCNVEKEARKLPNITLVNVDELSKIKDETLHKREAEIPKAVAIIETHLEEFTAWLDMRRHVPVLKAVKTKLREMHSCRLYSNAVPVDLFPATIKEDKIQRVLNGMALKMRSQNLGGCLYIAAINEYIA
jgi:glutamyl-tRNA reductase